jgi:hypothetical protein
MLVFQFKHLIKAGETTEADGLELAGLISETLRANGYAGIVEAYKSSQLIRISIIGKGEENSL